MSRAGLANDLEGLRLQVEVMTILVGEAVERSRQVVENGDREIARALVDADDAIDRMQVSLTEECYALLAKQAPVAADLRLVVSVIRVLHELERIGDLAIRVANAVAEQPLMARHPAVFEVLNRLAENVTARFASVQEAWSTFGIEPLSQLTSIDPLVEFVDPLLSHLMDLDGDDAVRVALAAMAVGRSFDRIGDHTQIMACRLQYLVTGDSSYLAAEAAW